MANLSGCFPHPSRQFAGGRAREMRCGVWIRLQKLLEEGGDGGCQLQLAGWDAKRVCWQSAVPTAGSNSTQIKFHITRSRAISNMGPLDRSSGSPPADTTACLSASRTSRGTGTLCELSAPPLKFEGASCNSSSSISSGRESSVPGRKVIRGLDFQV
jgi:hypothetical protein